MKNWYEKIKQGSAGITLISLVVTIIVLLILATVGIYSGISAINSSKLTRFTTQMKLMQLEVNELYEAYTTGGTIETKDGTKYTGDAVTTIGKNLSQADQEQLNNIFRTDWEDGSGILNREGYRYFDKEIIETLEIEGIDEEFLINVKTRTVISYEGLKYDDKMYYTLEQLPDSLYNVDYENPNTGKPTFDVSYEQLENGKWRIIVSNIRYEEGQEGFINKWQVKYQYADTQEPDKWYISDDLEFIVDVADEYRIIVFQQGVESQAVTVKIQEDDTSGVNHPELKDGMQAIIFTENGTAQPVEDPSKNDWYSYEETTDSDMSDGGTTDGGNSRWANAMLNGNYYVWIPRYAYKIDSSVKYTSPGGGTSCKIDIQFIGTDITSSNVTIKVGEGWIVHPAFTFGGKELTGIWVGKYETTGDTTTPTILPSQPSLTNINVSTMFSTAQKLSTTNYDAHMMKNTEWGAVAYLAQSKYGRNGTEISVNECINSTGTGTGTTIVGNNKIYAHFKYEWNDITEEQKYNGEIGKLASTTGNIYGVYDMSGGNSEYVMGVYGTKGNPTKGESGFTIFPDSKYYDLYTKISADNSNIGDALYETRGWNEDTAVFVEGNYQRSFLYSWRRLFNGEKSWYILLFRKFWSNHYLWLSYCTYSKIMYKLYIINDIKSVNDEK